MIKTFQLFTRQNLFAAVFLVLLAVLLWLLFSLLQPFIPAFLWALIIAIVFYPLYATLRAWCGGRLNLAAFLATTAVTLLLVLPGFFVLINLAQEMGRSYETLSATSWDEKGIWALEKIRTTGALDALTRWGVEPSTVENLVHDGMAAAARGFDKFVIGKVKDVLQNLLGFVFLVFAVLLCLFFFFREGDQYARRLVELLPLTDDHREEVVSRFSRTVSSVVRAMFLTAVVQGVLAAIGFAVSGLPLPLLFALVTAVNSFIPILGAASVWVPASLWLLSQNRPEAALGLALYGFLVISAADNVIKPLVIGGKAKLPILLVLFTILGGLKLYGFLGVFLGPIILSMGLAFLSIYRDVYVKGRASTQTHPPRRRARI